MFIENLDNFFYYDQIGDSVHVYEVRRDNKCPSCCEINLNTSDLAAQNVLSNLLQLSNQNLTNNQE